MIRLRFGNNDCKSKMEQIALMIDRKYNFYKFFIYSENNIEHYFNNSLFDGELVKRYDGSWAFYIHDCIACCGENVGKKYLYAMSKYTKSYIA